MRYLVIGLWLAAAGLMAGPAQAQVHVNIGINLPGPPEWAVIPGLPIYYAPAAPANVFQYNGQCYAFAEGGWYVGPGYNGPWIAVAPAYVPPPPARPRALLPRAAHALGRLAPRAAPPLGARVWPRVGRAPQGMAGVAGTR